MRSGEISTVRSINDCCLTRNGIDRSLSDSFASLAIPIVISNLYSVFPCQSRRYKQMVRFTDIINRSLNLASARATFARLNYKRAEDVSFSLK